MPTDTNKLNHSGEFQEAWFSARTSAGEIDITGQQDASPKNPVGVVTRYKGNLYRYVYFEAGTTVAGAPAYIAELDPSSSDTTKIFAVHQLAASAVDGKGHNLVGGVFLAAGITAARYIWIQVGGVYPAAKVGASTAFGDKQLGGSNDIFVRKAAATADTDEPFGIALAAVSNAVAPMLIINCAW